MEFRILGPLEVRTERGAVPLGGFKPRAVLAFLLLHANEPVSAERLALALWGEDAPSGAVKTVQVHVSRLRKALGDEEILVTTPVGYRLRVRDGELDADRFETLAEDGRRALSAGQTVRAAAVLREALSLWRGPPLEDLAHESFAQSEIARLEEQRLAALETRVEADLAVGRHEQLLGELQALANAFPTRERLAGQLMLALYRCGRQGDALDLYARTRAMLMDELGLEPGPALRALQRDILDQSAALDAATRASGGGDPERSLPAPLVLTGGAESMIFGRAADLQVLAGVYADVAGGTRRLMLVCGAPGIGKTRLAAEFARSAHDQGAIVLYGRCDEEALLAQQPFVEALRHYVRTSAARELVARRPRAGGELRRLVPEIADLIPDLPEPLAGDPEGARSRLFEAVGSLLCEAGQRTPVVLVLDDLHWADRATLLLLKYLVRYPRNARLMVLGMYRDTELDADHPLSATLSDLGREFYLERRALAPLDATAVSELVDVHVGEDVPSELGRIVYERTEGNAFFVVEVLRHLAETGVIGADDAGSALEIPVGRLAVPENIKDVIGHRVARLGRDANRLLAAASVLGAEFDLRVLQSVSEHEEDDLVDGLESAAQAQVIEEVAGRAGRYMFAHSLIRDTVYEALSASRRAVLHRRAGAAIEEARGANLEPYLSELAHHFAHAALSGEIDKAIEYGRRAGEYALGQSAYEQAAAHFRRTVEIIDIWDADPRRELVLARGVVEHRVGDPAYRFMKCELLLGLGDARWRAGQSGARDAFSQAADIARSLNSSGQLARAALGFGGRFYETGVIDPPLVLLLREALDAIGSGDSAMRARLLASLADILHFSEADAALAASRQALDVARRVGDNDVLLAAMIARHVALLDVANLDERLRLSDELLERARIAERPEVAAQTHHWRIFDFLQAGETHAARREFAGLAALARELRQPLYRHFVAAWRGQAAELAGRFDDAERWARAALDEARRGQIRDAEAVFAGQLYAIRRDQGRLPALRGPIEALSEQYPTLALWQVLLIDVALEAGDLPMAQAKFTTLAADGFSSIPRDLYWLTSLSLLGELCTRLHREEHAARLYELLTPAADRFIQTGLMFSLGSVERVLGLLAAADEHLEPARAHFDRALEGNRLLGGRALAARTGYDYARLLSSSPAHADQQQARRLLHTAHATAAELGMRQLLARCSELQARLAGPPSAGTRSSSRSIPKTLAPGNGAARGGTK